MRRISPAAADAVRAAGAVGGVALIVAGTYDTQWVPVLGCLAVIALVTTEIALARMRRWMRDAEERTRRQDELAARQAAALPPAQPPQLGADALIRLLEAVHRELRHAHEAADRAQAELADLSREWNALVQESMSRPADPCPRIGSD
ncbi:hypothetical protein [Kitasatospora sp. NPDC059571]|uniref:hypothetical protein n=1 Tax=Kitasatospora sp. NPDC059571 TaxID=3346871 RepID=UPI003676D33B